MVEAVSMWEGANRTGYKSSQSCKYIIMYFFSQMSIIYSIVSNGSFENITVYTDYIMSRPLLSVFSVCGSLTRSNATTPLKLLHRGALRAGGLGSLWETTAAVPREKRCSEPAIPAVDNKELKVGFFTVITRF